MKKSVLFLFLGFSLLFLSCTNTTVIEYLDNDIMHKIEISKLKESLVFKEIPRTVPYNDKKQLKYAKQILNDSIFIINGFAPFYKPIDQIDWSENPYKNDTWQLYFENLLFVSVLNHAYQLSSEIAFHDKAKRYIISFINFHKDFAQKSSKVSWYDHSCAFRTLHILQTISAELQFESPDTDFIQKAFNHISKNVDFMTNPKNYRTHNHSLMMDRSLLYLSKVFYHYNDLSNSLKTIASKRALDNFDKIIDDSGLAKEHSTTYHVFNHNLYKSIFDLIGNEDVETSMLLKYLKMNDVLLQLVKPDLTFPLWGDSQIEILNSDLVKKFGNDKRLQSLLDNKYQLTSNVNFQNNIATLRTSTADKSYLAFLLTMNQRYISIEMIFHLCFKLLE